MVSGEAVDYVGGGSTAFFDYVIMDDPLGDPPFDRALSCLWKIVEKYQN